jgi:hypothetical protein
VPLPFGEQSYENVTVAPSICGILRERVNPNSLG